MENRFLLLDDATVRDVNQAALVLGTPVKDGRNPLFKEEFWADHPKPWEARYDNLYPNVLLDPGDRCFKIWYHSFIRDQSAENTPPPLRPRRPWSTAGRRSGLLYAQSDDGLHWEKPALGVVEFSGSRANNLVMTDVEGGVFRDAHDADPKRRFKFFGRAKHPTRMIGAWSADGIHWSDPVRWPEHGARADTHNNAIWAPDLGKYVGITRGRINGARTVLRTESPDFLHWSEPLEVMRGNGPYDELYSMPVFRYGNIYLGLLAVMHGAPGCGTDRTVPDWNKVTTELAWSPDTKIWHRVQAGSAFIPLGMGEYPDGASDCGCIYASVPVFEKDGIRLYYGGSNGLHNDWREGSLNLAWLRKDGFAGYRSRSGAEALLTTRTFTIDGDGSIKINADIGSHGFLRAGLVSAEGNPIQGLTVRDSHAITTDAVDRPITWRRRRPDAAAGRRIRLQFVFRDAILYSVAGPLEWCA